MVDQSEWIQNATKITYQERNENTEGTEDYYTKSESITNITSQTQVTARPQREYLSVPGSAAVVRH